MKYYNLLVSEKESQWRFGITEAEKIKKGLDKHSDSNELLPLTEPLELILWFAQYESNAFTNANIGDLHSWTGNLMLDPPLSGQAQGNILIVSPKIKEIIEGSQIPFSYKFFEVKATKIDSEEFYSYFIFQMPYKKLQKIFYPQTEFVLKRRQEIIKFFKKGTIRNYEEYLSIREQEEALNERSMLIANNTVYSEFSDVVWGKGSIIFSERIKLKLDQIGMIGGYFSPSDEDVIFMESPIKGHDIFE